MKIHPSSSAPVGARHLIGLGSVAVIVTLAALSAVPALAGDDSGTLRLKGAATDTVAFASCVSAGSTYGPGMKVYYGPAGQTADFSVRLVQYGKHWTHRANLASSDRYFLQVFFYVNGVPAEYGAGAEQHPNKTYSHIGSGSLTITSNLGRGTLVAHMINEYHPGQQKLTVRAVWRCPVS